MGIILLFRIASGFPFTRHAAAPRTFTPHMATQFRTSPLFPRGAVNSDGFPRGRKCVLCYIQLDECKCINVIVVKVDFVV